MSLSLILDELAAKLRTALDDNVQQVVGRLNINPTPPSIDVYPGDPFARSESTGFGDDETGGYFFTVRARIATADNIEAQNLLLEMMDGQSDLSVVAILQDDQTLNGWASSVKVEDPTGYRRYRDIDGQPAYLGCEWGVLVLPEES